jgi:hypothetical protein
MSLLKRIKEKITPPKASISLKFNKNYFELGENIEGTVTVFSDEDFECKEIRCEITCTEAVKRLKRRYDEKIKREIEEEFWESATLYSERSVVSGPMRITKGYRGVFQAAINIPAGGRPSYKSVDRRVTWTAKSVIAIEGRPDVTSGTLEIQVVQPSTTVIKEKEVIREVVMIPCRYCGTLMPQTTATCPHCGARRTA